MYFNLLAVVYIGYMQPFIDRKKNHIELFNEGLVYQMTIMLTIFTDHCPDPEMRYNIGWLCILCVVMNVLINFGLIFKDTFIMNYLIIRKYVLRCNYRRNRKIEHAKAEAKVVYEKQQREEQMTPIQKMADDSGLMHTAKKFLDTKVNIMEIKIEEVDSVPYKQKMAFKQHHGVHVAKLEIYYQNMVVKAFNLHRQFLFAEMFKFCINNFYNQQAQLERLNNSFLFEEEKSRFFYNYQAMNILKQSFNEVNLRVPPYRNLSINEQFKIFFNKSITACKFEDVK